MAKKFYAVYKGRVPGVYHTWAECEKQVKGFGGAIFKSFMTQSEATLFANGGSIVKASDGLITEVPSKKVAKRSTADGSLTKGDHNTPLAGNASMLSESSTLAAYIDGSFDKRLGTVGYGGIIIESGKEIPFSFGTKEPSYVEFWNVAGELLAARYVIEYAVKNGHTTCDLYYDYVGIEMWATGAWKTNNPLTKSYAAFVKEQSNRLTIHFHKVAAHTGVAYNEWADTLAKEGLLKA